MDSSTDHLVEGAASGAHTARKDAGETKSRKTQMTKRLIIALATFAAAALPAQSALAATATVTGTVNAGTLSITTSATPRFSVTLNGTDKTGTYTAATTVTDATGTGSGWNLTITSTQFTTVGSSPQTLTTTASSPTGATNS